MQEGHSRRQMKEERRDAVEPDPDYIHSFSALSATDRVEAVDGFHPAHTSMPTESILPRPSTAALEEAASMKPHAELSSRVAKNRQKQLQQWAAARPTIPITSFYFIAPPEAHSLPPVSPTRVLLSGLGADELCGGYARYRTAFRHGGEQAARASMKADVDRIWLRNLGRDDRCASLRAAAYRRR